jgi:hypothetical protein
MNKFIHYCPTSNQIEKHDWDTWFPFRNLQFYGLGKFRLHIDLLKHFSQDKSTSTTKSNMKCAIIFASRFLVFI